MSLYDAGALWRTAGGNAEWAPPGVTWLAWSLNADNGGGGGKAVWDTARGIWRQAGIQEFPWMHVRSMQDLQRLLQVAQGENSPALGLNIEDVVGDGLDLEEIARVVKQAWSKPVHMPTLSWVQNGQGWEHMAFAVAALEIFPDENQESNHVQDCVDHAFAEGLTKVTLMYKTANHTPADYNLRTCHSLYTADDITPTAAAWKIWLGVEPCLSPMPSGGTPVPDPWYSKPYPKGPAIGPAKLPRTYRPPSHDKGTFMGPGVMAMKRAISRAQRWEPWAPEQWDQTYGDKFALGRGTGNVGDSGVRGYQRQEGITEDGVLGDETYQRMRKTKIPAGNPNAGEYIFDATCLSLLQKEVKQFGPEAIAEARFQKLLAAMKMMSDHTPGYLLGGGHGIPLSEVSPYQRLDCSSSTSKALYEAGMFPHTYAWSSSEFEDWGEAGVGKYFTVYYKPDAVGSQGHVWIRLHKSQWWRFDTSPWGDGGRGPKLRYLPRFTGGFQARHWPGM